MKSRVILPVLIFVLAACSPTAEEVVAPEVISTQATEAQPTEAETVIANASLRQFVIVPEESKASYTVEEEFFAGALGPLGIDAGFNTAFGWTRNIEGALALDFSENPPMVGENVFVVNIHSLSSDNDRRDEMIQRRFLESNTFPLAEYVISSIEHFPSSFAESEEISFTLIGEMTIREVSRPFNFDVQGVLEGDMLSGTAVGLLTMTDFGFEPPSIAGILTVSDPATITMEFVMREAGESGG
jgi:polyisoprenoid-binding protein YceI